MEETEVVTEAAAQTQSGLAALKSSGSQWISDTFSGPLQTIFHPIDNLFVGANPAVFKFFAVGLFVATILWVMLILKKEYVNIDRPKKGIIYDLRLWTLISMSPHMIIYWFFS